MRNAKRLARDRKLLKKDKDPNVKALMRKGFLYKDGFANVAVVKSWYDSLEPKAILYGMLKEAERQGMPNSKAGELYNHMTGYVPFENSDSNPNTFSDGWEINFAVGVVCIPDIPTVKTPLPMWSWTYSYFSDWMVLDRIRYRTREEAIEACEHVVSIQTNWQKEMHENLQCNEYPLWKLRESGKGAGLRELSYSISSPDEGEYEPTTTLSIQ